MVRKIFGEKIENEVHHDRTAAYVVLVNGNKIAVVKTSTGKLFLPSGKMEKEESREQCVLREYMEEMGLRVQLKECFAVGERYFYRETGGEYSHAIGYFFYSDKYEKVCEPIEKNEEFLWLSYEEAVEGFFHPHHRWAAEYVLNHK